MSILPPNFPPAPPEYNQLEERSFRARVAEAIGERLGKMEIPVFGGVPHAALTGTDPAFSSPGSNVITLLPFNAVFRDNPDLLNGTVWQLSYVMDLTIFIRLFHVSGAGGNVTITFYLYVNGVAVTSYQHTAQLNDNETYNQTVFAKDVPANAVLDIRTSHTGGSALILDMTQSRLWFEQLTPNPRFVGLERL